jgi:hypothetical protein
MATMVFPPPDPGKTHLTRKIKNGVLKLITCLASREIDARRAKVEKLRNSVYQLEELRHEFQDDEQLKKGLNRNLVEARLELERWERDLELARKKRELYRYDSGQLKASDKDYVEALRVCIRELEDVNKE